MAFVWFVIQKIENKPLYDWLQTSRELQRSIVAHWIQLKCETDIQEIHILMLHRQQKNWTEEMTSWVINTRTSK